MSQKPSYEDLVKRINALETEMEKRTQEEKTLKNTEKAFSQIILGSPIPTFVINNKHILTHWNSACENLTGISAGEILGTRKQWLAFYAEERPVMADFIVDNTPEKEIARYYGKKYRTSAVAEGAYEAEDFFPDLGEKGKWLFFTAAPLKNSKGKLIGAIETLQDFTERNLAEEALRLAEKELREHRDHLEGLVQQRTGDLIESGETYRTLVENVPLVVDRRSSNGEILFVNQFVEEIFGFSMIELFRNPDLWPEGVYDEDRIRVENLRKKSFKEGNAFSAEYRVRHKRGHIVHVTDHAIPFRTSEGRIGSVDGIIMDVTGRIKLHEEHIRAEGLKTVSEISNRLAHEIRNPLVSAGGFARRLLSSMNPEDPNRSNVEIIVKEVGRLETILRMMLAYIQPLELQMSQTDPNQLVERALSAVDMEIKERNLRVDLKLSNSLPEISIDRPQMELAVETLLKKAVNQIQENAMLSISTFQENDMFRLVIRYLVHHVSSDDVKDFFYPFTTSKMGAETVDLPMSKILVHKHGGTIDAHLEESGELAIHLSLPV